MDLENESQQTPEITSYLELLEHQTDLMIDKSKFSFDEYLQSCKQLDSSEESEDEADENDEVFLLRRDKTPKVDLDQEMKELIKSDLKDNLRIAGEAQNMVIK